MTRSGSHVNLLAAILAIALTGLAVVQFFMLRKAIGAEEDAFLRNAVVALSRASDALSAQEIMRIVVENAVDSLSDACVSSEQVDSIVNDLRSQFHSGAASLVWIDDDSIQGLCDTAIADDSAGLTMIRIELRSDVDDGHNIPAESPAWDTARHGSGVSIGDVEYRMVQTTGPDSATLLTRNFATHQVITLPSVTDTNRAFLVTAAVSQLEAQEALPIRDRIDPVELDSTIAEALRSEGIDLDYAYGVVDRLSGQAVLMGEGADTSSIVASPYRTRLFPHDILSRPNDLIVHFPAKQAYLLRQLVPVAVPAGLFLLVIAVVFVYIIRVMAHQQRFAVRLIDFINNMTHEFKTPISTIQLASEALQRDDIQCDRGRLTQFNRMIRDENRRMKAQVEKILQMAVIEEGAAEIKREPVDFHRVIAAAVDTVQLNVAAKEGRLDSRLEADRHTVDGDEVHLYNIVVNLLDNACKYSQGVPQIRVSTELVGDRIRLRVADRGIGIDETDLAHVFERYYRVNTGNRHDVKGFGLGLAYVKLVVEAQGGEVRINSKLGTGTEVIVDLPLSGTGA